MNYIEEYIKEIEEYVNTHDLDEDLLIRYVYIDLARRLSFNMEYLPFGNSKNRHDIYMNGTRFNELNKSFKNNTVICNSASKILEYVLRHFNINIKTTVDKNDLRRYPHVYNIITLNDKEYRVDLQEDMYRVKMMESTINYGLALDNNSYVISLEKQEEMDRKLGFINDKDYYTDEYFYLLKQTADCIEPLEEKLKFILENIDVMKKEDMGYIDRQWHHVKILERLFDKEVFDYTKDQGKIRILDCYKMVDGKRKPINCIIIDGWEYVNVFIYNEDEYRYEEVDFSDFIKEINSGLIIHKVKIRRIEYELRKEKMKRKMI